MKAFKWPSGGAWTIGGLNAQPAQLERELGFKFEHGADDLGEVEFKLFETAEVPFLLEWRKDSPVPCTDVLVDSDVERDVAVAAVTHHVGRKLAAFGWQTAFPSFRESIRSANEHTKRPPSVVLVLHGPSGVGKDSVIELLRQRTGIHRVMSSTDREPRPGEVAGEHYHFLTTAEFERKILEGAFLEHARVYDDWKGVERREIEPYLERGDDLIIRTDVKGARSWRDLLEGATTVILLADEETLRRRRAARDGEGHGSHAIRDEQIEEDVADVEKNDYAVINADGKMDRTVDELVAIIDRERQNLGRPVPRLRSSKPAPAKA